MMNDLIQTVSQRTGVPVETVQKVIQSAAEFIKTKVPPQYAGYVDQYLGGGGAGQPAGAGGLSDAIGGLFGGKK